MLVIRKIETVDINDRAEKLVAQIRNCTLCEHALPLGARPILQFNPQAKILIASQAPGRIAHLSGVPFNDPSGKRLRQWLGMTPEQFYDPNIVAIVPMGFCFPGSHVASSAQSTSKKSGDLPPRPECAATWHSDLLKMLPNLQLTLLIGQYSQAYHLKKAHVSVTSNVMQWREFWPYVMPLPHPSPRNGFWLRRNPWFEMEVIPALQQRVAEILA